VWLHGVTDFLGTSHKKGEGLVLVGESMEVEPADAAALADARNKLRIALAELAAST
jgi:hypothetical protein